MKSSRLGAAGKALFAIAALPALARASFRLWRLNREYELEELAQRMARVPAWRVRWLGKPHYLNASVQRLSRPLPPWRLGPCLKRSLLLLDLWSRCGLEPRLHLGAAKEDGGAARFHAWATLPGSAGSRQAPEGDGFTEIWSGPGIAGSEGGPAERISGSRSEIDSGALDGDSVKQLFD